MAQGHALLTPKTSTIIEIEAALISEHTPASPIASMLAIPVYLSSITRLQERLSMLRCITGARLDAQGSG